jgi:hypothetical protein
MSPDPRIAESAKLLAAIKRQLPTSQALLGSVFRDIPHFFWLDLRLCFGRPLTDFYLRTAFVPCISASGSYLSAEWIARRVGAGGQRCNRMLQKCNKMLRP